MGLSPVVSAVFLIAKPLWKIVGSPKKYLRNLHYPFGDEA
jgi:hypothetical protein